MPVEVIRPADRAAWLAARQQDVTASVAGALLGCHPYTTAYGLWAEKTGLIPPDADENAAMRRGRLLEPVALAMLREERPDWQVLPAEGFGYYRDHAARLGATPDGFARRPDAAGRGIVQVKTTSDFSFRDKWLDPDTREVEVPTWIAVQAIIEAELTGATWAVVGVMIVGRGIDLHVIDVPLHAGVARRVRSAVAEFWAMVESGGRPDPDWLRDGRAVLDIYRDSDGSSADIADAKRFDELVAQYHAHKAVAGAAGKEADRLKPQIIEMLGNADAGETAAWRVSAKTQHRKESIVRASSSRPLRITDKLAKKEAAE